MIKAKEIITHNGERYERGDTIENIKEKEAQRLVKLGFAYPMEDLNENDAVDTFDDLYEELDQTFNADPLKKAAKAAGLEFDNSTRKDELIEQIIDAGKAEEILGDE